jgi:hypothetical protein
MWSGSYIRAISPNTSTRVNVVPTQPYQPVASLNHGTRSALSKGAHWASHSRIFPSRVRRYRHNDA